MVGMFGVIGLKEPLIKRDSTFLSNSEKTFTSRNLSASLNLSGNKRPQDRRARTRPHSAMASYRVRTEQNESSPTLEDLERTLSTLKSDLKNLNSSLEENYAKSVVYARDANYNESRYIKEFEHETHLNGDAEDESDDEELRKLIQRKDKEAVSHLPADDSQWFRDPKHLTTSMGDFETSKLLGISTRSVSPTNRGTGTFGAEMATKNIDGQLTSTDLASSMETFPVRLTAPHIVGVRSLLPPKLPVKMQKPTSPTQVSSTEITAVPYFPLKSSAKPQHSDSPKPKWVPNSRNANASANVPPPLKKSKQRSASLPRRPATALGIRENGRKSSELVTRGRSITRHTTLSSGSYPRQIHPLPSETELRFLKSADAIDTRRALVENSPYQQELARLRLARLRVEEEYLLQLKRESELERIRGPKPKWYTMTGPEFHYECNKNTALQKNKKSWGKILQYRNELLDSSREFAQTV